MCMIYFFTRCTACLGAPERGAKSLAGSTAPARDTSCAPLSQRTSGGCSRSARGSHTRPPRRPGWRRRQIRRRGPSAPTIIAIDEAQDMTPLHARLLSWYARVCGAAFQVVNVGQEDQGVIVTGRGGSTPRKEKPGAEPRDPWRIRSLARFPTKQAWNVCAWPSCSKPTCMLRAAVAAAAKG